MCVEEEDVDLTDMTHGRCEHPHTSVRWELLQRYPSLGDPLRANDSSLFHR